MCKTIIPHNCFPQPTATTNGDKVRDTKRGQILNEQRKDTLQTKNRDTTKIVI